MLDRFVMDSMREQYAYESVYVLQWLLGLVFTGSPPFSLQELAYGIAVLNREILAASLAGEETT